MCLLGHGPQSALSGAAKSLSTSTASKENHLRAIFSLYNWPITTRLGRHSEKKEDRTLKLKCCSASRGKYMEHLSN